MKCPDIFLFLSFFLPLLLASDADRVNAVQKYSEISIDISLKNKINPYIFGQNTIGYDSCTFSHDSKCTNDGKYSNWGAGQWNPKKDIPNETFLQFTDHLKLDFLRFPGGCGVHKYNWKKTIGPLAKRPMYQFGIDEFLLLCEKLGAEPIITLSYFTGSNQDIADLVEYLNYPVNSGNPNGGGNWAEIRAKNGHAEPYRVKYFELGNEIYHGDHVDTGPPTPDEYARRYLACRQMMKTIDSKIKLGAVLQGWSLGMTDWDKELVSYLSKEIDFGIIHMYPIIYYSDSAKYSAKEIFSIALASPLQAEYEIKAFSRQLKELTRRNIPIAITEYNGHFTQNKPVAYRHSLGNALLVADLLRIFLTVDAPILGANYWQFVNSYWGLLYNDLFREEEGSYTRRPNYFIFELYSLHFGELILKTNVKGPGYASKALGKVHATGVKRKNLSTSPDFKPLNYQIRPDDWKTNKFRQLLTLSIPVKATINENTYLLTFSADKDINYYHTEFSQIIDPDRRYRLTGKIKTEDLTSASGVYLSVQDSRGWKKTGWAKSTQKLSGTNEWKNVMVEFQPLPDAKKIKVMIRRRQGGGNLRGKVWVKDVLLEDIGPVIRFPPTPYLSAVSSLNNAGDKINIIVINKNLEKSIPAQIVIKNGFDIAKGAKYWMLNGPEIDSINENMEENVKITEDTFTITPHDNSFFYEFQPHSVTAIELYKKTSP